MVTWEHDDVKKVAIVASAHRGPDYGFSCFVTYATGSSSESEFLAIKEMLHTLQLKAAAFMSSIAMHETVVVLDHGLDIQVCRLQSSQGNTTDTMAAKSQCVQQQ